MSLISEEVMRRLLLLSVLGPLAGSACAQHWIDKIDLVHPDPFTTLTLVDLADGGVVLGQFASTQPVPTAHPFLWTHSGGVQPLTSAGSQTLGACISGDGNVIYAYTPAAPQFVVSYLASGVRSDLTTLPGFPVTTSRTGEEGFGYALETFRTPMVFDRLNPEASTQLGVAPLAGHTRQDASVVAATSDGLFLLGAVDYKNDLDSTIVTRAHLWNRNIEPVIFRLVPIPAAYSSYVLNAASALGDYCAASAWNSPDHHQPWFHRFLDFSSWALPMLPGDVSGDALDIADAGFTLVGNTRAGPGAPDLGRVWCTTLKFTVRSIDSLLLSRGLDLSHWSSLSVSRISPDGQHVLGTGLHDGQPALWAAYVGQTCCVADVTDDGVVDLSDFFGFFNCFDAGAPCADLDNDPDVNLGDFFAFLNAFDAGC